MSAYSMWYTQYAQAAAAAAAGGGSGPEQGADGQLVAMDIIPEYCHLSFVWFL